ncbi:hypothetical protein [Streptomyces violaceus]|uniref:Uncharacterized protein n=1 Tax=Streptomyces violaceus TaxID=1936 RepID=A0ABZ1NVE9_STRVL
MSTPVEVHGPSDGRSWRRVDRDSPTLGGRPAAIFVRPPLRYLPLTPEAYADEQRARGVPEEWVRLSAGLYEYVRSGGLASLGDGVQRALGRAPRDFSEYAGTAARQGVWNT